MITKAAEDLYRVKLFGLPLTAISKRCELSYNASLVATFLIGITIVTNAIEQVPVGYFRYAIFSYLTLAAVLLALQVTDVIAAKECEPRADLPPVRTFILAALFAMNAVVAVLILSLLA